jgi:hypothetical protein
MPKNCSCWLGQYCRSDELLVNRSQYVLKLCKYEVLDGEDLRVLTLFIGYFEPVAVLKSMDINNCMLFAHHKLSRHTFEKSNNNAAQPSAKPVKHRRALATLFICTDYRVKSDGA